MRPITYSQWKLIRKMEWAFFQYYGDNDTKFKGKSFSDADEWISAMIDEYKGISYELKHRRLQEDDFSVS